TALLWFTVNATNCSDGVDGLAGSLTLIALGSLAALLYGVVGYKPVAEYLLIPHSPDGARWAILLFTAAGGLAAYLWYNAEPSTMLMGDAGSRMLGLLVGIGVLASGNPLLVFVVSPVILANGGAGLFKLVLLRALKRLGLDTTPPDKGRAEDQHALVRALHSVRFPLHDHCRRNLGWSNAQVLMRFMLIQAFLTPILFILFVKIR
ncbi:MAG: phospho-N-acetylmuramoyl-pentapeptide-transferase, partial [Kiritimatiellaeota bacterium]|nr:phospho-N-acetylmuramoyl-pentapeptide-transferase [Kiritimatiellota bacterium]